MKSLSHVRLFVTPWTVAYHALLSMGFSKQEYWSGLSFPLQEILLIPRLNLGLLYWHVGSLPLSHLGSLYTNNSPFKKCIKNKTKTNAGIDQTQSSRLAIDKNCWTFLKFIKDLANWRDTPVNGKTYCKGVYFPPNLSINLVEFQLKLK